ncbi:MAG TPA: aminoglycoside phosphotransferase family protein [Ktedonobacterales bacterium]|jgi:aminoglycoside phosphotransferase (APT) family kinase protein|nr:aminoglycoside phosphotransferase family protein [Ktedonobacterales bacterium]
MPSGFADKMHDDEVTTSDALVRALLAAQFPQWAGLPLAPVPSAGTDNALYRLGEELVVRMPRIQWAAGDAADEWRWLPRLAPRLPLAIPAPLALGEPGEGYPWQWGVYRWLPGADATQTPVADPSQLARDLAEFILALQRIETTGWPPPEPPRSGRAEPLATRDAETRACIAELESLGLHDAATSAALTAAWDAALTEPPYSGPPIWVHSDLSPLNFIVRDGRLSAIIDWSALGVGEPACDLIPAWSAFSAEARGVFRASIAVDDATWARGRGLALSIALIALPYYHITNPALANLARHSIAEILREVTPAQ